MPLQKLEHYNQQELQLSKICFALSHPARVRLIQSLQHKPIMTHYEIMKDLNLSETSVHVHLKVLQEQDLIQKQYLPNFHIYSINEKGIERIPKEMEALLQ